QISEETISEYYRKYLATPKTYREVQLGQIFLSLPGEPTPEQRTRVRNTARNIRQQLLAGKDFTQLVAIHSESPDRQQQGIMGWFAHGGTAQRFAPALDLSVGEVTEPIQSSVGFHILKVLNERWQEPEAVGESYDEVHARHILLQIPASADAATQAKIRHRAETIAAEMQGESDEAFAIRAKESSQGPSAEKGGDLGWFKKGMMMPEFEKVAFSMQAGETSGIVETQYGLHIIRVVENRHVDPNSLQANRDRIQQILTNVEMQEQVPRWITSLRAEATVTYRSCPKTKLRLPASQIVENTAPRPSTSIDAELQAALEQWRKAWSKQDISAYLRGYSKQFNPGKRFASLAAWKTARRNMIANKKYIRIQVQGIKISQLGQNRARIEFTQIYEADSFRSRDLKMLLMQKSSSGWKIIREMAAEIK
ncbi:MAG: peptidylprolyl isomerase, partial [Mariprofundus sp.]